MRVLLVSPDYASHYLPLSGLGQALARRGHDVVVATGPALAGRVSGDGFDHRELVLGPASNPGLARKSAQADGALHLRAFLAATRRGMIETLRLQAEARQRDLLWEPAAVTERLGEIVADVSPTLVVSDQLAFGATLALRALEQPHVSFHPGHPTAIPGPGELYGFPSHRPEQFRADARELAELRRLCAEVSERFTRTFNDTLRQLNPRAEPVATALSATSPLLTLLNYPVQLAGQRRALLPRSARFVGASVRRGGQLSDGLATLLEVEDSRPRIYVSLGSFLSARSDVLQRIVSAFRTLPVRLVVASGVTPRSALGPIPPTGTSPRTFRRPTCSARATSPSATAGTTRSPRLSGPASRCSSARSRPTSSRAPKTSGARVSATCSTPMRPHPKRSPTGRSGCSRASSHGGRPRSASR